MKISESDAKTKPGSLIAQGLSGLNGAKIHNYFLITVSLSKKLFQDTSNV